MRRAERRRSFLVNGYPDGELGSHSLRVWDRRRAAFDRLRRMDDAKRQRAQQEADMAKLKDATEVCGWALVPETEAPSMSQHGSYWETLDAAAITRLREIYEHYNIPTIINARNLDFHWRKDALTGMKEADAIKDLLRYMPAILAKLAANPDVPRAAEAAQGADILANANRQGLRHD